MIGKVFGKNLAPLQNSCGYSPKPGREKKEENRVRTGRPV